MRTDLIFIEGLAPQYTSDSDPQSAGTAFISFDLPHVSYTAEIS
jgi:hypothetical protein